MSAISALSDNEVNSHVADVFASAKAAMGKVPNLYRVLAHAPAALEVYTGSKGFRLTDAEILETIAHVAVNLFTNSVNNSVGTLLDFPKAERVAKSRRHGSIPI